MCMLSATEGSFWRQSEDGTISGMGLSWTLETEICSLLGSQEGLAHIALSIVDEGDVVLVPDPVILYLATDLRLQAPDFTICPRERKMGISSAWTEIPEDVAGKGQAMVVSYPNNPTTAMAPDSFYEELIDFAQEI